MEEKYKKLLDAEILEFISKTESFYPMDAIDYSVEDHRILYDRMADWFHSGRPPKVRVSDEIISGIPVRTYDPSSNHSIIILFMHGGGFMLGDLESHDDICAELAYKTGIKLISVDYSLAPEYSFFDSLEDCLKIGISLSKMSELILVGDSAGGTLAANLSAHSKVEKRLNILGQVLIYPGLGSENKKGSYVRHKNAPLLKTTEIEFYRKVIFPNVESKKFGSGLILQGREFSKLPKTVVFSAECDPLSDEGGEYCKKIQNDGGSAKWFLELGLVHGYLRARHSSARAGSSFKRIIKSILEISTASNI